MTLPLSTETLRAAYDYLATTPPFCRWNMPDSEDVRFVVVRTAVRYARHIWQDGKHTIEVSSRGVGHTVTLLSHMAHEMIHVRQAETKGLRYGEHGGAFAKMAKRVCSVHGFDLGTF